MKTKFRPYYSMVDFLISLMRALLYIRKTRRWAIRKILLWKDNSQFTGIKYAIAYALQADYAFITGGKVCSVCHLNHTPGKKPMFCKAVLATWEMSDEEILSTWLSLSIYNPSSGYMIKNNLIGIDPLLWIELVEIEISIRGIEYWKGIEALKSNKNIYDESV